MIKIRIGLYWKIENVSSRPDNKLNIVDINSINSFDIEVDRNFRLNPIQISKILNEKYQFNNIKESQIISWSKYD